MRCRLLTGLLSLLSFLCLSTASLAQEKIRVGIAQDISGPFSALGADAREGYQLAIKKLGNKLGGVPAEFLMQDMQGNPDNARQLVDRFIKRDKIDLFMGPIGSNVAMAVLPMLAAEKIPYLSNNAGPGILAGAQCNPWFFSIAWQNDHYHEAAGQFAQTKGFKRAVILAPNYPAGQDALNGFKRYYKGEVAQEILTKLGQLDYAAEIAQIRATKADALYIFLPGGMGINFIKQYVGAGVGAQTQLIVSGFSGDEDIIRAVGEPMLGLMTTAHWNHDFPNAANKTFVADYLKEYQRLPSIYSASAYDTVMLMDAAVRSVGGKVQDKEALRAAIKSTKGFASVRGNFKFNTNQYPIHDMWFRIIGRDAQGRITNKTMNKLFENHKDAYAAQCAMK